MSTTHQAPGARVHEGAGHVEVTGLSVDEVRAAIALLDAARGQQLQAREALRVHVTESMLAAGMPLVPPATQAQLQRTAALRAGLLQEHGYLTYASLATRRGVRESSVRTWVSRRREEHRLFTVRVGGQVLIPAVQLTETGDLDPAVSDLVRPLLAAGMDAWSLWAWLCSPTGLLSGDVPARVVADNPGRAQRAARRRAAQVRHATHPAA